MDGQARILVVEDEGLVALDLQDRLIRAGYNVPEVATSSEEALLVVASQDPDLILMDIRLKGPRDGIETAHEIHASAPIPIVFVTANADADTLQRARECRPAGFFVKPVPFASLTSSIEMALYRSRTDRFEAVLAGLHATTDQIVLITDLKGTLEFASPAWNGLTGLAQTDLLGRPLASFVSLQTPEHDNWTEEILRHLQEQYSVSIPRGSFLNLPNLSLKIPIVGQATLYEFGRDSIKIIWEMRDVSGEEEDYERIRRELQALARGYIASGVSETVYRLFEMTAGLRDTKATGQEAKQIGEAGMEMSRQFMGVGNDIGPEAELVDVNKWIRENASLLSKLLGHQVTVCFDLCADTAEVRLPAHSFGHILLSTFGSLRHRLAGPGTIRLKTHILRALRDNVCLDFHLERSGLAEWTPFGFPFEIESTDIEISLANAIVTAAEGRLHFQQSWANAAQIQILLPRASDPAMEKQSEKGIVLVVGEGTEITGALERQFESDGYKVIRSASEGEALIVAQLHAGDIATVVADADSISPHGRDRIELAFLNHHPRTKFIWRGFGSRSSAASYAKAQ